MDVSDDEWTFVPPYLLLMTEEAPQRDHSLRATHESGPRADYDGAKRRCGSQVPMAMDILGYLLAAHVAAAASMTVARCAPG